MEACHVYASMGHTKYVSAYRHELIRRLYKKYFKLRGQFWPSVGEAKELDDLAIEELYEAAYSARAVDAAWSTAHSASTPSC